MQKIKKDGEKIYLAENVLVKHLGGKSHHPDQQEKMESKEIGIIYGHYFIIQKNIKD